MRPAPEVQLHHVRSAPPRRRASYLKARPPTGAPWFSVPPLSLRYLTYIRLALLLPNRTRRLQAFLAEHIPCPTSTSFIIVSKLVKGHRRIMTFPALPPILSLPTAPDSTITSMLDLLFEPSPEIHRLAIPVVRGQQQQQQQTSATYTTYPELIHAIGDQMLQLVAISASQEQKHEPAAVSHPADPTTSALTPRQQLHSILGSHPRLGAKKVDSALSRAEQAQLQSSTTDESSSSQSNTSGETEAQALARLNALYETTFPGLRYVVFVNGRGRDVVMRDMQRRIDRGDVRAEEKEGVDAMVDIAMDRAGKILGSEE